MDIGIGTVAALWLLSGAAFWAGFLALGLGFEPADEGEGVTASDTSRSARNSSGSPVRAVSRSIR